MSNITTLLAAAKSAEPEALDRLFAVLYHDLQAMARGKLFQAGHITTVDTIGLVNEAYLRFLKAGQLELADRGQFLAYASHVMRSIIVDAVRKRQSERGVGDNNRVTLSTDVADAAIEPEVEVMRVNEALIELAEIDRQLSQVVELRYFGGFSDEQIAELTKVSVRTVQRQWEKARLFLYRALHSA